MDRILTYTIKPEQEGMQLLDFLRSKGFSRGILSSMKADKSAIQLNGERGFGKSVLQAGDSLHIHIPEADSNENILPVKMDFSIPAKYKRITLAQILKSLSSNKM